jgi:hypothetical protein
VRSYHSQRIAYGFASSTEAPIRRIAQVRSAARNLAVTRTVTVKTLLEGLPIHGHGQLEGARKQLFHKLGFKFMKEVAIALRLNSSDYSVKVEPLSQDSSGEIWFHTRSMLIIMSQDFLDTAYSETYKHNIHQDGACGAASVKRCFGLNDYGHEQKETWMPTSALETVSTCVEWITNYKIRQLTGECDNG